MIRHGGEVRGEGKGVQGVLSNMISCFHITTI